MHVVLRHLRKKIKRLPYLQILPYLLYPTHFLFLPFYIEHIMTTILSDNSFLTQSAYHDEQPSNRPLSDAKNEAMGKKLGGRSEELNTQTINKVCADLQQQKLQINSAQTELRFDKKLTSNFEKIHRQREEIMEKKSQMLQDLKGLEQLQSDLAKKSRQQRPNEKSRLNMSHVSKEDVETLKSLKAKKREHDQSLQRKVREHEESVRKYEEERRKSEQGRKREQIQRRKKAAAQKVQDFMQKQVSRKEQILRERAEFIRLKERPKLFQTVQVQALAGRQNFQKELKAKQSIKRVQRRMSHSALKEHQAAYLRSRQEQQNNRNGKIKQKEETLSQSTPKFQVVFLEAVMDQRKRKLEEKVQKWNTIVVNTEKRSIFSENVRQEAKNQLVINSKSRLLIIEPKKPKDLERSMIYERGNKYMQIGNSCVSSKHGRKVQTVHLPSIVKTESKQQTKQNSVADYLRERRLKRQPIDSHAKLEKCLKQGKIDQAMGLVGIQQGKNYTEGRDWKAAMSKIRVLQSLQNRDTF